MDKKINSSSKAKKVTTYCVRVAYDGSRFSGWAKQIGLKTVEGEINKILKAIFQVEIAIDGASRTDTGVHAYDQVFTFKLPFLLAADQVTKILQEHFTRDIKIKEVTIVPNKYDLRKNVKYKEYRYYINMDEHNPFKINYQLQYGKEISSKKLKKALKLFSGRNYFYNFSGLAKGDLKSPYRVVDKIKVRKEKKQMIIIIQAKGFVRYQIRYIIAAALDYLQDKVTLDEIKHYLSPATKEKYPYPKAVAAGLYLNKIVLH